MLEWADPIDGDLRMTRKAPSRGGVTPGSGEFGIMQAQIRRPSDGTVGGLDVHVDDLPLGVTLPPGPVVPGGLNMRLYRVEMRFDVHFLWEMHDLGRTDISGPLDPSVSGFTKREIMADLTPAASTPPKPPRKKYWASDITRDHELFHARDSGDAYARARDNQAEWLDGQSASSIADAGAVGAKAVTRMQNEVNAYMGTGDAAPAEIRAYQRDAPFYRERVDAVAGFRAARRAARRKRRRQEKENGKAR